MNARIIYVQVSLSIAGRVYGKTVIEKLQIKECRIGEQHGGFIEERMCGPNHFTTDTICMSL